MGNRPSVGVISDSPLQRHNLQAALTTYGLKPLINCDPGRFEGLPAEQVGSIGCWILELENEDAWPDFIDTLIARSEAPILFGLGTAPERHGEEYPRWERRLFAKLTEEVGSVEMLDSAESLQSLVQPKAHQPLPLPESIRRNTLAESGQSQQPVERIWVLAASLGGPAAVKEFLDELPRGLPVAFIYAQHIDANFSSVLARVLARHSAFRLKEAQPGDQPKYGEVLMVPVQQEMIFDDKGCIEFKSTPWPGPYGPSIDQVMLNVANHFGARCGTILFSGMGNDGAIAAPLLRAYGSKIWVQNSASCANSSMPDSVQATGASSFSGTPRELAAHLVQDIEKTELLKPSR